MFDCLAVFNSSCIATTMWSIKMNGNSDIAKQVKMSNLVRKPIGKISSESSRKLALATTTSSMIPMIHEFASSYTHLPYREKIVVEIFKIPHIILTFKKNKGLIFAMEKHWSCTVNFWPFLTMVTHTHQIGLGLYYVLSTPIRCRSNARWFQLGLSANLTLWNSYIRPRQYLFTLLICCCSTANQPTVCNSKVTEWCLVRSSAEKLHTWTSHIWYPFCNFFPISGHLMAKPA